MYGSAPEPSATEASFTTEYGLLGVRNAESRSETACHFACLKLLELARATHSRAVSLAALPLGSIKSVK